MIPFSVLDPGHGGNDRANIGPTGYVEADGVLDIGLKLRELLMVEGYSVSMTREKDQTVSLYDRPAIANQWGGQLFISLHTNAAGPTAHGIETFYSLNGEWGNQFHAEAKRVAAIIQRQLVKATGLYDRGIKTKLVDRKDSPIYGKDYYAVIRRAKMPALIVEMGFHTNPKEEALLKTPEFRQKLAQAIFDGIKEAYPIPRPKKDYEGHWGQKYIDKGINAGYLTGDPDGKFRPEDALKRVEHARTLSFIIDKFSYLERKIQELERRG